MPVLEKIDPPNANPSRPGLTHGCAATFLLDKENLTQAQSVALQELQTGGFATAEAYRAREMLRWVRAAATRQAARWRVTHLLNHVGERLENAGAMLDPVREAVGTVRRHAERILQRWQSGHSNARLEARNGLFRAARARARGYLTTATYACMTYPIGAPIEDLLKRPIST